MKKFFTILAATFLAASMTAQNQIVLRLMGDSTMADKDLSYENPERGWGQRLKSHVDGDVLVANYAQNGRSTRSVQTLGIWDRVKNDLKAHGYRPGRWMFLFRTNCFIDGMVELIESMGVPYSTSRGFCIEKKELDLIDRYYKFRKWICTNIKNGRTKIYY